MRGGRAAIVSDVYLHCWNSGCRLEVGREKQPRGRWEMQIQLVPSLAYIRVQLESPKEFSSIKCFKIIIIKDMVGEGRWPLGDVNATFWLLFSYSDFYLFFFSELWNGFSLSCNAQHRHASGGLQTMGTSWKKSLILGMAVFNLLI